MAGCKDAGFCTAQLLAITASGKQLGAAEQCLVLPNSVCLLGSQQDAGCSQVQGHEPCTPCSRVHRDKQQLFPLARCCRRWCLIHIQWLLWGIQSGPTVVSGGGICTFTTPACIKKVVNYLKPGGKHHRQQAS